ncbi:MAG: nucleotidyltransferase family protein [Candidatus Latescibacterota bacterium]
MEIKDILERCKAALSDYYGSRFMGLVLYGSLARNQAVPGSDIDMLVLLQPPVDYFHELYQIVEVLYPVQLESERLISAKPVSPQEFEQGRIQLYRNARREGVLV